MSYDFTLFRPKSGVSLEDSVAALHNEQEMEAKEGKPLEPSAKGRMDALVAALLAATPDLEVADHTADALGYIELNRKGNQNGIQITVHANSANISVPYWHTKTEAAGVMREIFGYLKVLEKDGGFRTHDPQLGRVLDVDKDVDEALSAYSSTAEKVTSQVRARPELLSKISKYNDTKPWWKFWGN